MIYGTNWVAIPAPLYYILLFLSIILIPLSVIRLIRGIRNKKNKGYYIILGFILVLNIIITVLIPSHVLIANTMIGG